MIEFSIVIEERPDTHIAIKLKSSHGHLCTKGELECFKKFYTLMNKEFHNIKPANIRSIKIGKG